MYTVKGFKDGALVKVFAQDYENENFALTIAGTEFNNHRKNKIDSIHVFRDGLIISSDSWRNYIPHDLFMRMDDEGGEWGRAQAVVEAVYLLSVIEEGGSSYDDQPVKEVRQIVRDLKKFVSDWR